MTAPFFALFLLPEPELFLLFRPLPGGAPGAALQTSRLPYPKDMENGRPGREGY